MGEQSTPIPVPSSENGIELNHKNNINISFSLSPPPPSSSSSSQPPTIPKLSKVQRGKTSPDLTNIESTNDVHIQPVIPPEASTNHRRRVSSHDPRNQKEKEKAALAFFNLNYLSPESTTITSNSSAKGQAPEVSSTLLYQTHPPTQKPEPPVSILITTPNVQQAHVSQSFPKLKKGRRARSGSFGKESTELNAEVAHLSLSSSGGPSRSGLYRSSTIGDPPSSSSSQLPLAAPYPFEASELAKSPSTFKGLLSSVRELMHKKDKKEKEEQITENEDDKNNHVTVAADDFEIFPRNMSSRSAFSKTSSRAPEHLLAEVHTTLASLDISFNHLSPFCLRCNCDFPSQPSVAEPTLLSSSPLKEDKEEIVVFDVEVCRVPGQTYTYYLRAKLVQGSGSSFNVLYNRLFQRVQLVRTK